MNKIIYLVLVLFVGFTVACSSGGDKTNEKTAEKTNTTNQQDPDDTPKPRTTPKADPNQPNIDKDLITKHLADKGLEAQSTESGLHFIIEEEGDGPHPTLAQSVVVNCKGTLLDGTEFWSGEGIEFPLARVIPGWQEGIPKLKKGGKGTLLIPSGQAYGVMGTPDGSVPPNSVLKFEVELLDIHDHGAGHEGHSH